MTAHAHHLKLVDAAGELKGEACEGCIALSTELVKKVREITRLKNEETERLGLAADAATIRDVLVHHKRLFPGTKIITGKAAWKAVRARLADKDEEGNRAFTPLHLKAAAMGLKLGRTGSFAERPHGAAWLFGDEERVQYWTDRCVTFKRATGTSALAVLDELGDPALAYLADRCWGCGELRLAHLMHRTLCQNFDDLMVGRP